MGFMIRADKRAVILSAAKNLSNIPEIRRSEPDWRCLRGSG